jgi:uncharacterized protein YcnI
MRLLGIAGTTLAAGAAALWLAGGAWAHAGITPAAVQKQTDGVFVLAVPTEKANATTTQVELTPPEGFVVDAFAPSPGWRREEQETGTGEERRVTKVTWSGGSVPEGEFAEFRFTGEAENDGTFAFDVRQTYSDGSIVDWSGPESSDEPAPRVQAVSDLVGGADSGGTSTLSIIALVVGGIGVLLGAAALLTRGGRAVA